MNTFKLLKAENFQGGAAELRVPIELFRSIEHSPVERPFDQKWAHEIKKRIAAGYAVAFQWALAEIPNGQSPLRIRANGQHSSWAMASLLDDKILPSNLAIHLDTYAADDQAGIVSLFRQFDARKSARSRQDLCGAYQGFQPALKGCNRTALTDLVNGISWYRRYVLHAFAPSGDEAGELLNDMSLHPFLLFADELFKSRKANELKKTAVIAAIHGTYLEDTKDAGIFWRYVATGTLRTGHDAAKDLAEEWERIKEEHQSVSPRDLYAQCVKAWLAHRDGERVDSFKVYTKTKDLPILGE
jgi:hypothetical protein